MRSISRDPFARQTLYRDFEWTKIASGCHNCGELILTPVGNGYLWQYFIDFDDHGRQLNLRGRFCSDDCMFSFHDLPEFQANYDKED